MQCHILYIVPGHYSEILGNDRSLLNEQAIHAPSWDPWDSVGSGNVTPLMGNRDKVPNAPLILRYFKLENS